MEQLQMSPSMRREWIEMYQDYTTLISMLSPSMRREWIEIKTFLCDLWTQHVSLHAEGVD